MNTQAIIRYCKHLKLNALGLTVILAVMYINLSAQALDCTLPLSCNANIQISLGTNCTETVTAQSLIKVLAYPVSEYTVQVKDNKGKIVAGNVINSTHIGQRMEVSIKVNKCGLSCWGYAWIEDKLPPVITGCDTVVRACGANITAGSGVPMPIGTDACGTVTRKQLPDVITKLQCTSVWDRIIERPWIFTDQYGNVATCVQVIMVKRTVLSDVIAPPSYDDLANPALECGTVTQFLPNGAPNPQVTGFPTGTGCDNIQVTYKDTYFALCGKGSKVLREWLIIDWCNGKDTTLNQIIKILDRQGPQRPNTPGFLVLRNDTKKCSASYKVPDPNATDCSAYSYIVGFTTKDHLGSYGDTIYNRDITRNTDNTFTLNNLPVDTTMVIYKMTDACSNVSYSSFKIVVQDKEAPSANCLGFIVVSLRDNGWAELTAESVNNGSEDNCKIVKYEVRRQDSNCPDYATDRTFRPSVNFCCSDINTNPTAYIKVVLRVTDQAGNSNECISNVRVQDKQAPVITCPPNVTLECYQDYKNLSLTNGSATATDNCGARILPFVDNVQIVKCGVGRVLRTWTAVDSQGLTAQCVQTITLVNTDPFSANHITFPRDTSVNVCVNAAQITPDFLNSKPVFSARTCADLAVSFTDEYFEVNNACQKILRTWRVINWCDYDPNNKVYFTHVQKILVQDNVKPTVISGCVPRTILSKEGDCKEEVHHRIEATDNCTPANLLKYSYEIDLFSNQTIDIKGVGAAVSGIYPVGNHTITFRVVDGCGNEQICRYTFLIKDDKKPSPVCVGELVWVLGSDGKAEIWAKDFNLKSEDFCGNGENLKFAFDSLGRDSAKTFTCANVPNGKSARIPLRMYVFDSDGNFEFCSVILVLQDSPNTNACPDNEGGALISGSITTSKLETADKVKLVLEDVSAGTMQEVMTDANGRYQFTGNTMEKQYMLKPEKMDDIRLGVNVLDLLMLQKHILSIKKLDKAHQLIAGDIDNDKRISASDLVALRKIILGITDDMPNNRPWRFVPRDFKFDNANPYNLIEYKEYAKLGSDDLAADFMMIKIGDVDADFSQSGLFGRSKNALALRYEQRGNEVDVIADQDIALSAIQLAFNGEYADVIPAKLVLAKNEIFNDKNRLTLTFITTDDLVFYKGDKLFTLIKQASGGAVELDHKYAVAVNSKESVIPVTLEGRDKLSPHLSIEVYPNPFTSYTTVKYQMSTPGDAMISLIDYNGKVHMKQTIPSQAGWNSTDINANDLNLTSGMYFLQLSNDKQSKVIKLFFNK